MESNQDRQATKKDLTDLVKGLFLVSIPVGAVLGVSMAYITKPEFRETIKNYAYNLMRSLF